MQRGAAAVLIYVEVGVINSFRQKGLAAERARLHAPWRAYAYDTAGNTGKQSHCSKCTLNGSLLPYSDDSP